MRLNARTGAALLAIVVGLTLIVFAALGSKGSIPGTRKPAPDIPIATGIIEPLDPMSGVRTTGGKPPSKGDQAPAAGPPSIFDTEYGDRGEHKVTVAISANGPVTYRISWRGGKIEAGAGPGFSRTRTITGGFPLATVVAQGAPASRVTCTITVDGAQKATRSTTHKWGVTFCTG